MSKNKRRQINPQAFMNAVLRQQFMPSADQMLHALTVRAAILAMQNGHALRRHINDLAEAVNVALVLSENYRDRDEERVHEKALIDAQIALVRVIERARYCGKFLLDGAARTALTKAASIYETQLDTFRGDSLIAAHREVMRRQRVGEVIRVEPVT